MIDLHAHSTISDGTLTPTEIIRLAKKKGLTAIAITDHDSIDGHQEAIQEAHRVGIDLVKGIEFSVAYGQGRIIHILGLGIEPSNEGFMKAYTDYRRQRSLLLSASFDYLNAQGIAIKPEDVQAYVVGGYMDRQAIAKYLVAKGYAKMMKNAWVDYLDHVPYVEGELIKPQVAFDAIHAAGGKAFMAHFHLPIGLKGYSDEEARAHLHNLKEMGLDGLEFYYPSFSKSDQLKCGQYIQDFDFLKSGGSDFHGANRPNIELGHGEGAFEVPDQLLEAIISHDKQSASA